MRTKIIDLNKREAEAKELLRQIEKQRELSAQILRKDLPEAKTRTVEQYQKLDEIGVAEDYQASLLCIVGRFGDAGVRLPFIRRVMTDQVKLDDARKELGSVKYPVSTKDGQPVTKSGVGYLTEKNDGNTVIIVITEAGKQALAAQLEGAAK